MFTGLSNRSPGPLFSARPARAAPPLPGAARRPAV